jgi:integrase
MRIKLTPSFISSAEAQSNAERTIYWDADLPGFGLVVTNNGAKSFVVQYRANKRSRRLAIRATLRLSEARKEAKAILGRVAKGGDPLAERRKVEAAAANTLQTICETYLKREGRKLRTIAERQKTLRRLVYPVLGAKPIDDVRRSDIARLLDRIEDHCGAVMADHTLSYLRRVLNWHATRSDEYRTPITRGMTRTKPAERARDRILTDNEIRAAWIATGEMRNAFGPLVRYILLTACRRDEAAEMRRDELVGDIWTMPAARNKGKRDHVVPLSRAAQKMLGAVPVIGDGKLVFTHDGKRPVGGFSKFKARLDKMSATSGWTLHDLRRTRAA